jgi:ribonuclease D
MSILFIHSQAELISACTHFKNSPFICVDTEFHRETTYYSELALIQIADASLTVCIDPLALDDLSPVAELFSNTQILKVFHACYQDLEIFHHLFGALPCPIFDTQIAAALIGYGDQIGYAALIKDCLNIEVDKSQTRTDWLKRPLNDKQLEYAANDVLYLSQAYPLIVQKLTELNRLNWLDEDFALLSKVETFAVQPQNMWKKVKGHQKLRNQQLAVLQALSAWRETLAINRNRPRRRIISDDALIDICRQKPANTRQLLSLRCLNKSRISQHDAEELIQCIEKAMAVPAEHWPRLPKKHKISAAQDTLIDSLSCVLKYNADLHNINHSSLATRKQLEALVCGERDLPILNGWRKTHAGQMLLNFLDGKLCLSVQKDKTVISPIA